MFVRSRKIVRTTLRRDASILRFAPWQVCFANIAHALRMLPYMQCIPVAVCFSVSKPNRTLSTHLWQPISQQQFYPLRWQPIFIPAQGSSDTIKTVGGEAVRRFFSLKYAVLLYTISTLFREPRFAQAKTFQESFLLSFFSKKRQRIPSRPPAPLRHRRA